MTKPKFQISNILLVVCFLLFVVASHTHAQINVTTKTIETSIPLVWESDTYTPPFYKGKALSPSDSGSRIIALPPSTFGPDTATYTWKFNGRVLGSQSGVGVKTLTLAGSPFTADRFVVVTVKSADGTQEGTGTLRIPSSKPKVLVYEDSPLSGVHFESALEEFFGQTEADISLLAYPLFFSTNDRLSGLVYKWVVGGQSISEGGEGEIVARSDIAGTSTVQVSIRSLNNVLQQAVKSLNVIVN